ncbi:cytochrome aa3 quinol oxidase subunit II [Bacillus tianshenii]|nr:cytochrome aa3 quinol oxidase subunit II [Bacillus tianshenii]
MNALRKMLALSTMAVVLALSGCSQLTVLDPKGPVGAAQRDLIMLSIWFMLFIVGVVFVLFTIFIVKYRERPGDKDRETVEQEGSKVLEIVWTAIPILIVIALSVPTVKTIYALEEAPKATAHKEPLVIEATSVDWKWIFTYPEQNIETVNYLHIPEDRPVLFKLTSADSMAALWIPSLGGQKYNMAGMQTKLYLQADEPGVYKGRNANYTGEGFAEQRFKVYAQKEKDFESWVQKVQQTAPKLTKDQYDQLMLKGNTDNMTFSSTHSKWVDHAKEADYAIKVRKEHNNGEAKESH